MPQRVRLVLVAVLALAFASVIGAYLGAGADPGRKNLTKAEYQGYLRPPGMHVPPFSLRDQDGRRVTGTPGTTVYAFVYSHCRTACPLVVQQIRGALDDLGRDVPVVGVSVDPRNDTPASAKAFLAKQSMTGRMDFLLGTRAELEPLWTAFGIAPQTKGRDHSAHVVVVDGEGRQRVGYPASQLTPEALAADLRRIGT